MRRVQLSSGSHLLPRVLAGGGLVEAVCVLEILGESLQHRQRLAEVHLQTESVIALSAV